MKTLNSNLCLFSMYALEGRQAKDCLISLIGRLFHRTCGKMLSPAFYAYTSEQHHMPYGLQ